MAESPIPQKVRELLERLTRPRPMRRGSLSRRYVKCGKPGCPCAHKPEARHGPYFNLTRARKGRTRSRFLSAEAADRVRQQIEAGKEFRKQIEAFWAACEQWADLQIEEPAKAEGAEKRGSRKSSPPRSSRRSRRS
jgi:hypothetical protein